MNVIKNLKKSFIRVLGLLFICSFALAIGFAFVNGNVTEAKADESTVVEYAVLKADNSWLKSNKRIAFQIDKNNRPADGNYDINGGSITLERDGKSYKRTDGMTLTVYTNGEECVAYMELWAFGNELGETYTRNVGDVYTIEGQFGNIKIKETKISVAYGDVLFLWGGVHNESLQTLTTKSAPDLSWATGRWYFKANELLFTNLTDNIHYIKPKSAENVVLIRNNVPYIVGQTEANAFAGSDGLSFYTADLWWTINGLDDKTAKDGDILVVGGAFSDGVNEANVETTTIKVVSIENKEQYVVHNCTFVDVDGVEHYYEYNFGFLSVKGMNMCRCLITHLSPPPKFATL